MQARKPKGVFVTGIDTEVGKTVGSGGLISALGSRGVYWKPVQTGTLVSDDTEELRRITGLSKDCFADPVERFPEPVSPHLAAERWNKVIGRDALRAGFERVLRLDRVPVVEGAGGVLSPFSGELLFRDVIKELGLPVLVVAADRLGAVNHTLMTLEALNGLEVAGVVFTHYTGRWGNAEAVEKWAGASILARLPENPDARGRVADAAREPGLRAVVGETGTPEV